jgi:chromosome segregation ATPase
MSNPVFDQSLASLRATFASIEAEISRQGELEAKISAVKASLSTLEGLEKEARGRLANIEGDVQSALRRHGEATNQAQQIITDARSKAAEIREQALLVAEQDAERITMAALEEARAAVKRKRGGAGA